MDMMERAIRFSPHLVVCAVRISITLDIFSRQLYFLTKARRAYINITSTGGIRTR